MSTITITDDEQKIISLEFGRIAEGIGVTVAELDASAKKVRGVCDGQYRLAFRNICFGVHPAYVGPCYNPMPATSVLSRNPDGCGFFYGNVNGKRVDVAYARNGLWKGFVNGLPVSTEGSFRAAEKAAKAEAAKAQEQK